MKQLTHNDVDDGHPTWAPNGKQIAFTGMVDDIYQIFSVNAGGGTVQQLTFGGIGSHYHPTFSPDGKRIIYVSNAHNHYTLWIRTPTVPQNPTHKPHRRAFEPSLSKGGKTLVFSSDRSDHMRIYLMD